MTVDELVLYAAQFGLNAVVDTRTTSEGDRFVITVDRSPELGLWSMPATDIALAKTIEVAIEQAKTALDRMRPRLEKQLQSLPEAIQEEERLAIAAGYSSEGTVTPLRVERDGSVHLAEEDLLGIARAVVGLRQAFSQGRVVVFSPGTLEAMAELAGVDMEWGDPDATGIYTPTFTERPKGDGDGA